MGTLILHHDVKDNTYNIVDGQQRTITFALLLKSCNENIDLTKLHLNKTMMFSDYSKSHLYNNKGVNQEMIFEAYRWMAEKLAQKTVGS